MQKGGGMGGVLRRRSPTRLNAPEVPRGQDGSLKTEEGGWIYPRKRTGDYLTVRIESGTRDSLTGMATGPQ